MSEARTLLDTETLVSTTTLANNFQISLPKAAHCLSLLRASETSLVAVFMISGIDDSAALRYLVASGEEEATKAEASLVIVLSKGLFALGKISALVATYTHQVEAYLKQGGPFLFGGERITARSDCLRHGRQPLSSTSSSGSSNSITTFPACGVATSEHAKSTSLKTAPVPSQALSFFSRASTDLSKAKKREISAPQKDSDDEVEWEDERNTGLTSKCRKEEDGVKQEEDEGFHRETTSSQQVESLRREEDEEKISSASEEEAKESKKKRSRKKASVPQKDYSTRGAMDDFVQDGVIAQHRLEEAAGGPAKKKTRKLVEKVIGLLSVWSWRIPNIISSSRCSRTRKATLLLKWYMKK